MTDQGYAPSERAAAAAAGAPDGTDRDTELARLRVELETLATELADARIEVDRWRRAALLRWDEVASTAPAGPAVRELDAVHATVSWRVTRPLRAVSRLRQLARGTQA